MNIITGEKIQQYCDIYLGINSDYNYNPIIRNQPHKHVNLHHIQSSFHNPYYIFCYTHPETLFVLSQKIHFFKNDFVLISHNSDGEIRDFSHILNILQCDHLKKWVSQNVCFFHEKLSVCPIGIANCMWPHGNLSMFENLSIVKTNHVYFNFNIDTHYSKRSSCYHAVKPKVQWLHTVSFSENIDRLKTYEFCICPEGNGCDTHRLWEALYLKTVPIVVKSDFITILQQYKLPMVILETWSDLDVTTLHYSEYDFTSFEKEFDFTHFVKNI